MNKAVTSNVNPMISRNRLMADLHRIEKEGGDAILASPEEDNIYQWEALLFGPEKTQWEGGAFKLSIKFTEEYPTKAPEVRFISKIFHPNGIPL